MKYIMEQVYRDAKREFNDANNNTDREAVRRLKGVLTCSTDRLLQKMGDLTLVPANQASPPDKHRPPLSTHTHSQVGNTPWTRTLTLYLPPRPRPLPQYMRIAVSKYSRGNKGGGGLFSSFSSLIGGGKTAEEVSYVL